jgi:hypothetical protein
VTVVLLERSSRGSQPSRHGRSSRRLRRMGRSRRSRPSPSRPRHTVRSIVGRGIAAPAPRGILGRTVSRPVPGPSFTPAGHPGGVLLQIQTGVANENLGRAPIFRRGRPVAG